MLVKDILKHATRSELSQLALKDVGDLDSLDTVTTVQQVHRDTLIGFLNLGVAALHRKFQLDVVVESIQTAVGISLYQLRENSIGALLNVYDATGRELTEQLTTGTAEYDYKRITYTSFLFTNPTDTEVHFVFQKIPTGSVAISDNVDILDIFLEPLLYYIATKAFASLGAASLPSYQMFSAKYESSCLELASQGYDVSSNMLEHSLLLKGFP
ncbi:MAG: hypothetical protein PF440_02140 [Thiomicrorhabdus sp.]|jgi:hypothetical protein|nr:hypothetical protein [Thiomicrorhabdus sp.]